MSINKPKEIEILLLSFGPVPSRRLGRSLGINNIPPKACTYACLYCQVGRTTEMHGVRRPFYKPEEIFSAVNSRAKKAKLSNKVIDYITFVPDGEPTLDINLGHEIDLLKSLGIKIAIITNASLIWRKDVREDLKKADWVSIKLDACQEKIWRKINRPHGILKLQSILDGMLSFSAEYSGEFVTETMLLNGVNDGPEAVKEIAGFLGLLKPSRAYLSIPTRPPAESWITIPDEQTLNSAYQMISRNVPAVELLIDYEGNEFTFTGNIEKDLLSITSVHPMREEAVKEFLANADSNWEVIHNLIAQDQIVRAEYNNEIFYMRRLDNKKQRD